jgi:hypothetical protein
MPPPGEPSRNPIVQFLVWVYDRTWFHWLISFLAQPVYTIMGAFYRLQNLIWPINLWKDWQRRPQPKYPIPLTKNDLPVKTRLCDGCGSYLGTLIGTYVDIEQVKKILPPGTSLDPDHIHENPLPPHEKQHALIMLFGYTEDLHFGWWPFRSMNYLECGVAVPHLLIDDNVQYVDGFFHIPMLHLNRLYPVILGWIVGYRKKWSRVTTTYNTYTIKSLFTGRKLLHAEFTRYKDKVNVRDKTEHWEELCEEPHLNPFGSDKLFLHFHWDWLSADFEPVDATVTFYEDFPGIVAGVYHFQGIDKGEWVAGEAPMGAFRLAAPFELLLPFSLRKLRAHTAKQKAASPPAAPKDPASPREAAQSPSTPSAKAMAESTSTTPPPQPSTDNADSPTRSNSPASGDTSR